MSVGQVFSQNSKRKKPNYLKEVAWFHIDSFNYAIKEGLKLACMDIDPVYTKSDPYVKISIYDIELTPLQLPMDLRHHKRTVYPAETRIRGATYYAELTVTLKFETKTEEEYVERTFFVPLMLKSDLCFLNGMSDLELQNHKEDTNDPGGYFIVKGKERIIRLFVVPKRNYPLALIQHKWKELRNGYSEYGILISSVKDNHACSSLSLHFVNITKETEHASVEVRVFYKQRPYYIPYMLLLKSLVDESDASIIREILKFKNEDFRLKECLMSMMRDMLCYNASNSEDKACRGVYSHQEAKRVIGTLFSPVYVGSPDSSPCDITDHLLKTSVLIHLTNNEDKFKFLCFSIYKLFSLIQNNCKEEDLDNPVYQEVLSPSQTYMTAVKEGTKVFLNSVKNSLTRKIAITKDFKLSANVKTCTNRAISLSPIIANMVSTGNMPGNSHGLMSTTGYTIPVKRTNVLEVASQFAGVHKFSMKFYSKNMRKFYPESWGFLCPVQTPEGEHTGLKNYLASGCKIVSLNAKKILPEQLYKLGAAPFFDPVSYCNIKKIIIFVDGKVFAWILQNQISSFLDKLRRMRSLENISVPTHTEIVFIPEDYPQIVFPGIYIFSSACRLVRGVRNLSTEKEELLGSFEQVFSHVALLTDKVGYQYAETNDSNILCMTAALLPFSENNPATRNTFTCVKIKQAVSFPFANLKFRSDTKSSFLTYPQSPMISTSMYANYNWDDNPMGTNICIAILSYSGFDMEDAIVFNRASIERGLMQDIVYKTTLYDFEDLALELDCKITDLEFKCDPDDPFISNYLDAQGVPYVGDIVRHDSPVLSVFSKKNNKCIIKKYGERSIAHIDSVKFMGVTATSESKRLPTENKKVSITYRYKSFPEVGDKFCNRHGQKGVCGSIMATEDLPFTADGMVPDILFNPHGLPSRMSIGMLLEILASKSPGQTATKHTVEPFHFSEKNSAVEYFSNLLKEAHMDAYGCQKFYSGTSGEELEAEVFCGSVYYFRLHHIVEEKYQVQSIAEDVDPKTQQPINLNKAGAIRFGEMERDAILSHGAMHLTMDRLLHNSDECTAFICKRCQTLLYPVLQHHNPLERSREVTENKYCKICEISDTFKVRIPYVLVYLITELAAVGIKMKFSDK